MEKTCYTTDEMLRMIANTLVVYSYHIDNNGLTNGKMGVILFLYRYAAHTGNRHYENFAGELLDGMMNVAMSLPPDFENGLPGVGWAISRLMADGCVEGNPNKVLRRIDERVLGRMDCDRRSILAQAVYMAERLHAATPEYDLTRHATGMLEFIIRELTHTQLCPTLYHVNSALHFLASARSLPGTKEPCERIMAMLPGLYERMSSETRATRADTHIHQLLLRQLESDIKPSLQAQTEEHAMTTDNSTDIAATEQFLQASWQELTYFGRIYSTLPPPRALSAFIDRKQESMQEHGFCMERGLAGMGLAIMARDKKNADTAHMTTTKRNATQA